MSTDNLHLQQLTISPDEKFARELESIEASVIKPIVRRKLSVTLSAGDTGSRNQDALELVGDIRLRLLTELRGRADSPYGTIRDLGAYAAKVAFNACHNHFRERYPRRVSLRNKLRYLLLHHAQLSLWRDPVNGWICGMMSWEGRTDVVESTAVHGADLFRIGEERESSAEILTRYFANCGGPVLFDELVNNAAEANGVADPLEAPAELTDTTYPVIDTRLRADRLLELRSRVASLWEAVLDLQPPHRKALLLNLRDESGDNLLAALPLTGIATIRQIAHSMEMEFEELAGIWNSLPWDDNTIARRLGVTRQQVINLRQTARAKLVRTRKSTGNI